jgi:hypothetical protein
MKATWGMPRCIMKETFTVYEMQFQRRELKFDARNP